MSSKITEAIAQLNHDVTSLYDAAPSMQEAAQEKVKQVKSLRVKYLATHPEILSGKWNLDISLSDPLHSRLTGWNYDINGTRCDGGDSGNFLISGLAITDDEYTTIEIPYSDEEPLTWVSQRIRLVVMQGEIRIDFYNIESPEVFRFIKEHSIIIETPDMDNAILGFQQRIDKLNDVKQAVIDAGVLKSEPEQMFVDCAACDTVPREALMHTPVNDNPEPIGIQFNADEVSALHKHSGVIYESLTNIISRLSATTVNIEVVKTSIYELSYVQTEIDQLAVEIGGLDTKDEPLDLGMAGSAYWNILQSAIALSNNTVEYIEDETAIPLFVEVRNRLNKLTEILERCNTEFEETYL